MPRCILCSVLIPFLTYTLIWIEYPESPVSTSDAHCTHLFLAHKSRGARRRQRLRRPQIRSQSSAAALLHSRSAARLTNAVVGGGLF